MATLKGFKTNEIKPQPGFEPSQTTNGGWDGTHTFAMNRASFGNSAVRSLFRKGVPVTQLDPSVPSFFSFMTLDSTKVRFGEGDIIYVTARFAGGEGSQYGGSGGLAGGAEPTYDLDGTLSDRPLADHPKWAGLSDIQKTALGHLLSGVLVFDVAEGKICQINEAAGNAEDFFDPFLPYDEIVEGDCLEFAKLIASGITTYVSPSITWTERTEGSSGLTGSQLNDLGKISNPRGSPPDPTGGRDWMLTSAHQHEVGDKFTTELTWALSEKEGFSNFLYD